MATRYKVIHERIKPVAASKIVFDDGILAIEGIDQNGVAAIRITFDNALVTRIADEGARLRLLNVLGNAAAGLVIEAEDSDLIRWLQEEGLHTRDMSLARHYLVLTGEEITDVVSFSPPVLI